MNGDFYLEEYVLCNKKNCCLIACIKQQLYGFVTYFLAAFCIICCPTVM